ncbi:MAG: N-acetylmuramoyl-L-alanine amidase, family 2 [Modestobacter sp.]|nr:N-acetylmuramoyl-L-alanine amidase, family 2 [Modestobacter sp.]
MRRLLVGSLAVMAFSTTLLTLPVYAAPTPPLEAVEPSIDQVYLGSVEIPVDEAVVTTDGTLLAAGEDAEVTEVPTDSTAPSATPEASATPDPTDSTAPSTAPEPSGTPETGAPEVEVPTTGDEVPGVPVLTVSQPETDSFSAVGVTWSVDDAVSGVDVRIRVRTDGGEWGEWTALEADDVEQDAGSAPDGTDLRAGTAPYYTGPAKGVEVVVQAADGATPQDVRVQLIDPGTSAADSTLGAPAVRDQAHASLSMPMIYSRAQWGADESIRGWDPEYASTIKAATVHHTADSNNYSPEAVPGIMRSIYAYHTLSRGWGDIGYNVIVDKYGRAWEGRYSGDRGIASTIIGAHAGGFNTATFGVSMIGDYTKTPAPQPMVDTVAAVIGWKLGLYGVDPGGWTTLTSSGGGTSKYAAGTAVNLPAVFGHRDVGNTTCPGDFGYARLDEIRAKAAAIAGERSTPMGALDAVTPSFGRVSVSGWALDLDTPQQPIAVHVYVDGAGRAGFTADGNRPDLGRVAPPAGAAHGFGFSLDLSAGAHTVCVYAINAGAGSENPQLGCRAVSVPGYQDTPMGSLDVVRALGGRIGVSGWAVDGSTPDQAVPVHVYVDGTFSAAIDGNRSRADIGVAFPGAGEAHGFSGSVPAAAGDHRVCVYAINLGKGVTNPELGCATVTVAPAVHGPIGAWDTTVVSGRTVTLTGWVLDPDAAGAPGSVHVYVDGRFTAAVTADAPRPDVAAFYPGLGVAVQRGYRSAVTVHSGTHQVCVYAINQGAGTDNPVQACNTVAVAAPAWDPVGVLDTVSVKGITATLTGWVFDPDNGAAASRVHVYVDGTFRTDVAADASRPDVGAAFGVGDGHGLVARLSLPAGDHTVCAYALNSGDGSSNPLLGCRTASVSAASLAAYGSLDQAVVSGGRMQVAGWAIDPDDPSRTLAVHVYVNSAGTALTADTSRPDLAIAFPAAGDRHGYAAQLPLPAGGGPYTVCAYAIGVGDGTTNVPLGCRSSS